MKKVTLITVNFNQPVVTEALLASVTATNTYHALDIIVVDNGSRHDPTPEWRIKYRDICFIRSDINLGFAGGNNLAIDIASGEYLFLANNDTEFTPGLVAHLVAVLDSHPEAGIVCPKIRYFDKPAVLQYAGFTKMNYYTARNRCIGQFEIDNGQYDRLTGETAYAHGAAMMVRRAAIDKAGTMAANYFLYYEEMDWCERIVKAGFTIRLDMQALIYHKESVSVGVNSPLKEYFMNRNRILFIRRNCSFGVKAVFWPYFLGVVAPRNIIGYIKRGQWAYIAVLLRAIGWNFTHGVNSSSTGYTINK